MRPGRWHHTGFAATLAVVVCLLTATAALGAEPRRAAETIPSRGSAPVLEETLSSLLETWSSTTPGEQTELAWLFAVLGFRKAVPELKHCAATPGAEAASCLLALAMLGRTGSASVFRAQLRSSNDPHVIAITALTLASWRDGFSNSLLVRTLLSGRGGEIGGLALALALDRMDNRWKRNYFRLARLTTPYPQVRLATTALLSGRMSGWRVGVIRRDLVRALDEALAGEGSAEDSLRARIAIWGLTRPGSDGCPMVLQRLDLEVAAGGDRRERVRSLVSALDGDCLLRARREASLLSTEGMAPRAGSRERRARFPLPGVAPVAAEGAMPEVLRALADRVALGDVTPSLEEIAAAAAERARGRLPTDPAWDAFTLLRHPPGERISRTSWRRLEETWQDMPVPQDFDTFDPAFLQPPWWPEGMEITIDDGPRPLRLAEVLDILAKHEVHATFFFIGSNLVSEWLQDPERLQDLLRRLLREGHAIGYHSMDHDTTFLRHLQAWLPEQVADDIELFRNVLELALGHPYPLVWARAPGGMGVRLPWLRAGLALGGLRASVPWTVDPEAWPPGISSRRVRELARTLEKKAGRTIILLHETTGLARELDAFLSELRIAREVPRTAARVR